MLKKTIKKADADKLLGIAAPKEKKELPKIDPLKRIIGLLVEAISVIKGLKFSVNVAAPEAPKIEVINHYPPPVIHLDVGVKGRDKEGFAVGYSIDVQREKVQIH
jgi:hypothetical protein